MKNKEIRKETLEEAIARWTREQQIRLALEQAQRSAEKDWREE